MAVWSAMAVVSLLVLVTLQSAVRPISCLPAEGYSVQEAWSSVLWSRFPEEVYPLFLSDLLQAGRIQEAQARSRVWNLTEEDIESYSGYLTVNRQYNSNLFFWFCPAETNQTEAPVLLWLNGGPGRTSMVGALLENGPLEVDENGTQLKRRSVPWTKHFSMLYVDNPLDAGYSFTRDDAGLSSSMKDITDNLYSLLIQFFKLFPQYSHQPFYVGGQSYAGKYVPALGYHIHERNTDPDTPRQDLINFKGIYVGAGYCDPANMMPAFPDFLYNMGIISNSQREAVKKRFHHVITEWPHGNVRRTTYGYMYEFFVVPLRYGKLDSLDNLLGSQATNDHLMNGLNTFMVSAEARLKLHVGFAVENRHMLVSGKAGDSISSDIMVNTSAQNAFLMDHYKVLHYSGNLDVVVSVPMTEAFLEQVQWAGQEDYRRHYKRAWYDGGTLAGWFAVVRNFTRVVIRNSGHMAPYDQPEYTLAMMRNFIFDLPFAQPDPEAERKKDDEEEEDDEM